MGSHSDKTVSTSTSNLALDRSATVDEGTSIMDSIIVDPSDRVMMETIAQHRATFSELTAASTVQLDRLLDLGSQVLTLADRQQVRLEGIAYEQLRSGVEFLEAAKNQGKYAIDFAEQSVSQSFNLASELTSGNDARLAQALDLVSEVKTGDQGDMLKYLVTTIALFGVAAIYLSTKE